MPILAAIKRLPAVVAVVVAGSATALPRHEQNPPAEYRTLPWSGALPACEDPAVLAEIAQRFASREQGYWETPLSLVNFETVAETGYRTNGASYIPRRYCRASARFNDGVSRRVVYNLGEQLGFIGMGYGVTWCVVGLDRNHAYSPACRAAGP